MIPVTAMFITFSPDLAKLVEQEMATGRYGSENDLLLAAVQLLSERTRQLEALRQEIQPALDRLDRGEGKPFNVEAIKAEGRRLLAQEERRS
jgi:putative addiction module CopG family antidote